MGRATPLACPTVRYVVPWRTDHGERQRLWTFCRTWWSAFPIAEASSPVGPFNRAAAINAAATGTWDVLVVLDADVLAPHDQVFQAIERAWTTGRFTRAYEVYSAVPRQETATVLDTGVLPWVLREGRLWSVRRAHASSLIAIPRALFDDLGGFDERFVGWGQEDVAFAHAARLIGGAHESVPGVVWHLYHERSPEKGRGAETHRANQLLGARYRRCRTEADVRVLLDEGRPRHANGHPRSVAWG